MQIFVDKCKRLVQGVCIDSATRGLSLTPPVLSEEPERPSHPMKTETKSDPIHARKAIVTRYLCPTNTRGARIRATCDRGSVSIPYPDEANQGADAHAVAVRALLAKFAEEDGAERSWPEFDRWVCGGMPQSSKDAYVWVQLPEGGAL